MVEPLRFAILMRTLGLNIDSDSQALQWPVRALQPRSRHCPAARLFQEDFANVAVAVPREQPYIRVLPAAACKISILIRHSQT